MTLVFLNVQLIRALRVMQRLHKEIKTHLMHRENITTMLVVVVTVFVACELPDLAIRIAFTVYEFGWGDLDVLTLRYANSVSNTLLTLNSSSNFIIYCLVGKKFRRILTEMVPCAGGGAGSGGGGEGGGLEGKKHVAQEVELIRRTGAMEHGRRYWVGRVGEGPPWK